VSDYGQSVPPASPVGEAFEQLRDSVLNSWRRLGELIQLDIDRAVAEQLTLEELASCGPRLARVGFENAIELMSVLSDNLALLTWQQNKEKSATAEPAESRVSVSVPAGTDVVIKSTPLKGEVTGRPVPSEALTVAPGTCPSGPARPEEITVTMSTDGLPGDVYSGELRVCVVGQPDVVYGYGIPVSEEDSPSPVTPRAGGGPGR